MPRVARVDIAGYQYHVINRAVMRLQIFNSGEDYLLFETILENVRDEYGMRVLAYSIMPNHWHFLLYPEKDGDLGIFMHRLTNAHTRQVKARTHTNGTGPLYQGRYKSFLIQKDPHLLTVLKYIERNPVRAGLVTQAEEWRWGSAWRRIHGASAREKLLSPFPLEISTTYKEWINTPESLKELEEIRTSVNKGAPYGGESWVEKTVKQFKLDATMRNPGRPRGK
ncbi:MAG: transposase [bacterium]|nr:transposase [bacterium]